MVDKEGLKSWMHFASRQQAPTPLMAPFPRLTIAPGIVNRNTQRIANTNTQGIATTNRTGIANTHTTTMDSKKRC